MTSKLLFRLLPVQILLAAIGSINGIVSSLFASNSVGVDAMSAVGLYNPINQIIVAVNMLLIGGASILCGEYLGRNESDKMRNTFYDDRMGFSAFSLMYAAEYNPDALYLLWPGDRPEYHDQCAGSAGRLRVCLPPDRSHDSFDRHEQCI